MAASSCLLLAPVEGWWPLATWRAFRCLEALRALLKVDVKMLKESRKLFHFYPQSSEVELWVFRQTFYPTPSPSSSPTHL